MTRFALRYPYLVLVLCLMTGVFGVTSVVRMPVDLFPPIKIPVVVVATFFSGMPPEQIENAITGRFERFFTLGSGIDRIESRSLPGVSLIKVYFQPGTNADSAVTTIANLAMANLRRLPPGTLPPVVLKFDASSLPVCLITLKGEGLNEARLRDTAQYAVRNQVANVPGASVPQPFGGKYRQIMVYVDPLKLEAHQLSLMDVVRSVNESNLILPAGDVKVGPLNYSLYANSQINSIEEVNRLPLKNVAGASVLVGNIGEAKDAAQIQNNIVRVDGQPSVYLPVLKQGGDANTISVVDGIKNAVASLVDVPKELVTKVVFDQSAFVKGAIKNIVLIGIIGMALTSVLILMFFGNMRATVAVLLSIPVSVLAAFVALDAGGNSINTMLLGGLALAFSRMINNSVVVLDNIFRHLEQGEDPATAAQRGGEEVATSVLASTLATAVVFFPVVFLYGVSKYLFTALALGVVLSLFASYIVALTVVPLFCAKFIKPRANAALAPASGAGTAAASLSLGERFQAGFGRLFNRLLDAYGRQLNRSLGRPALTVVAVLGFFLLSLGLFPLIGVSYFPKTDPGQFVVNLDAPTGTRIDLMGSYAERVENIIRQEVGKDDLDVIVSNIGVTPGFSSIYTTNSAQHTAFVQASLKPSHKLSSYDYMDRVRRRIRAEIPELNAYFQTGGIVDAVTNLGFPAPIDVKVTGSNLQVSHGIATELAQKIRKLPGVSDVLVPQSIDYPALKLDVDRARANELGLTSREVIQNVITALASNQMIAPSYWVDPKSGNDYLLTVQYPEGYIKSFEDLMSIPLHGPSKPQTTRLDAVSKVRQMYAPTEVNHYQLRRVIDIYVSPSGEDLGRLVKAIEKLIAETKLPEGIRIDVRGTAQGMKVSFESFGLGLILAVFLVYLILVAQFQSFIDPLLILLAVPTGLSGVLIVLFVTGTTLNVMSLMGVVMVVGIVVSNSILIVDSVRQFAAHDPSLIKVISLACKARLRPILITSLATLIGLAPMAAKFGTGSEAYAPLALAIIGGLALSFLLTIFIVPAAYLLVHRAPAPAAAPAPVPV